MSRARVCLALFSASVLAGQTVEVTKVLAKPLSRSVRLTGELLPYQSVDLHARVTGFVEAVLVDRGSIVDQGQTLVTLSAPEMEAQIAEAQAKARAADSQLAEAKAKLRAAEATYAHLKEAAETPGAIAGNELVVAEENVAAATGAVASAGAAREAAQASVEALKRLDEYLKVQAPFSGVITERLAHPGALAGPGSGALLRLEQVTRLRLATAVPEAYAGRIALGARVSFRVAAHPERAFAGVVARSARSVDPKTRTMAVELDVANRDGALAPGMYPEVNWPVQGGKTSLVVPATSIVTTTERVFVIRVVNGRAEWVDVRRGAREGDQVEVYGPLSEGDIILLRGSDEIRDGAPIKKGSA